VALAAVLESKGLLAVRIDQGADPEFGGVLLGIEHVSEPFEEPEPVFFRSRMALS
jgi:hypothetical protein